MKITKLAKLHQPMPSSRAAVGLEFKAGIGPSYVGSIGAMLDVGQGLLLMVDGQGALHVSKVSDVVEESFVQLSMFGLAETRAPQGLEDQDLTLPPPAI